MKSTLLISSFLLISSLAIAQNLQLGLLVYHGGGDWYANPTALKNLSIFCNSNLGTHFSSQEAQVEAGSPAIFNYPFIHATGHGRIDFNTVEAANMRSYLISGGFLHIDDNYGMDQFVRPAMKKVFPELNFVEVPFTHPIYHMMFQFDSGLPKIHEHDNKPPRGFALILKGRIVCFYSYECDLGDGWEDPEVHHDSEVSRNKALQMGANLVMYALTI